MEKYIIFVTFNRKTYKQRHGCAELDCQAPVYRKKNVIVPRSHLKGGHVLHRLQQKYRKYLAA